MTAPALRLVISNGALLEGPEAKPEPELARCPKCGVVFAGRWFLDQHACRPKPSAFGIVLYLLALLAGALLTLAALGVIPA